MATHSSVLAWRIPGMGEPGGLPSMRSHRVGHNWSDLAAAAVLKYIYIPHLLLVSIDGYLDYFHMLAIVNNSAVNIGVNVSFWVSVLFFRYIPRNEMAESYGSSIFSVWRNFYPVFHTNCTSLQPIVYEDSLFSTFFATFVICVRSDDSHSDRCESISHCGFDLH